MRDLYRRLMDALYVVCLGIAGVAIVVMSLIIPWGVFTRYVLGTGSFWPEPISIFLAIQMTFYGAAACYRAGAHIGIDSFVRLLPAPLHRLAEWLVDFLMLVISVVMIWYGVGLSYTTWLQVYPEFQFVRVGAVYTAIPAGGVLTLLFVLERMWLGPPAFLAEPPAAEEAR